jgi:hypothetical protein
MSPNPPHLTPLPENARVQALDAALESITTKLDAVLSDTLKIPRPPKQDIRDFRTGLRKGYRNELMNLIVGMTAEDVSELTLVNAYERAVSNWAVSLAGWADEIARSVPEDDRVTDPQVKQQAVEEATAVAAEAKALVDDIKKDDAQREE